MALVSLQMHQKQYYGLTFNKNSNARRYSTIELHKIYRGGEKRYKYKIAPGFTDIKKKGKPILQKFLNEIWRFN